MIIEANVDNTLPSVNFDEVAGKLEIKGRSIFGSPEEFYTELNDYIDVYANYPSDLDVTMDLEYFNTPTARCLVNFFKSCKKVIEKGAKLKINWIVDEDDTDMQEAGEDFSEIIKHPFDVVFRNPESS